MIEGPPLIGRSQQAAQLSAGIRHTRALAALDCPPVWVVEPRDPLIVHGQALAPRQHADTSIAEARAFGGQIPSSLAPHRIVTPPTPNAHRGTPIPHQQAGPTHGQSIGRFLVAHCQASGSTRHAFCPSRSFRSWLSQACSATRYLSRAFSSSSALRRRASLTSLLRRRSNVCALMPCFRHPSFALRQDPGNVRAATPRVRVDSPCH